ncbi:MAG TPA: FAD-linked oxidase C-terminal domain-containing protein [Egibacteraceae bacterium]
MTRHLYASDASMYAIEPLAVAFPRDADDVAAAVAITAEHGVPLIPRGAGTGLAGQAIGRGVVLDCSRHLDRVLDVDPAARVAVVEPGVVQDDLNRAVAPAGLAFGPDTSTADRATLGGMIGTNAAGSRSCRYGMTVDHVLALDVVLADGSRARLAPVDRAAAAAGRAGEPARLLAGLSDLAARHADAIAEDFPPHWRRAGGYRLDRLVDGERLDPARVVVGSEGTLVVVTAATVALVEAPRARGLAVASFASTGAAIAATPEVLTCDPVAVELVDRTILDLARRSRASAATAASLAGDPDAVLLVEVFGDDDADVAAQLDRVGRRLRAAGATAVEAARSPAAVDAWRQLRKTGLGHLMAAGRDGERPLAFIEDTAVPPERLAAYTERLLALLERHGLRAGVYGHASVGCLHVRPFVDLRAPGAVELVARLAEEVRELVVAFGGVLSSEHGDGLVRSAIARAVHGERLYAAMRELKALFDPHNHLNPGKIVDAPPLTEHLRDPALPPAAPLATTLSFAAEGGMRAAADRCQRIGVCRKTAAGVMCPSYMATREEEHSPRGRAGALVKALSSPAPAAALADERLHEVLDLCLGCKACVSECPLTVDVAALKAEALHQRHRVTGVPPRARVLAEVRTLHRLGAALAPLSNLPGVQPPLRRLLEATLGIDRRRPLPRFTRATFPRWAARRRPRVGDGPRGDVVVLADCFTSYTEPAIPQAAVTLLEQAGWRVRVADRVCCGRAAVSQGRLDRAVDAAAGVVAHLGPAAEAGVPIVGVEPSCVAALRDDLQRLRPRDPRAAAVGAAARLADDLVAEAVADGTLVPTGPPLGRVLFHGHCHQKAVLGTDGSLRLLAALPGAEVTPLDAGCCGMAGSFGYEVEHYELSLVIGGQRLFPAVLGAPPGTIVTATGVSCREQIAHGTRRRAAAPLELAAAALRAGGGS